MDYSLVFRGQIADGANIEDARGSLARMLKLDDDATLDRVFSGAPFTLKKGLAAADAVKYEQALLRAGIICEVQGGMAATIPAPAPVPPPAVATAAPAEAAPARAVFTPDPSAAPEGFNFLPLDAPAPDLRPAPKPAPVPVIAAVQPPAAPAPTAQPQLRPPPVELEMAPDPDAEAEVENASAQAATEAASTIAFARPPVQEPAEPGETEVEPEDTAWIPGSPLPASLRGWSWGGFFAPFIWGSFNGMRLSFVPLLGIRVLRHFVPIWAWILFYLAFGSFYLVKGRELAWANKNWRDAHHFRKIQRYWTFGGLAIFVLTMGLLVTVMERQHRESVQAKAAAQLASAEVQAEAEQDPAVRAQMRSKAQETYLGTIEDPVERGNARRRFADEDAEAEEQAAPAENSNTAGSETSSQ
jgi:hypothetical protein